LGSESHEFRWHSSPPIENKKASSQASLLQLVGGILSGMNHILKIN
jgi:hypothetical protein